MKHSEEAIEKVLAGLRNSDAPLGMERRILDAVQDDASARSRSGWRRLRPMWLVTPPRPAAVGSLACGVALAGMFALALAVPAIRRLGHPPAQSKTAPAPVRALPPAAPETVAKSAALPQPGSNAGPIRKTNARRAGVVRDSDALALDEMRAASHPAPEAPLTEQEKLLLRIAHKRDPVEMAALNPVLRAAREVEEKASFQNFFEPAKTGDNK